MNAAYYDEVDRVKKSGVFAEIHTKHDKSLQARLAALPEEDREAARQRLTAEALFIMKALRKSSVLTRPYNNKRCNTQQRQQHRSPPRMMRRSGA